MSTIMFGLCAELVVSRLPRPPADNEHRSGGRQETMVAHAGLGLGTHDEEHDELHRGEHCPFLNRSDGRCAECLSLDHIDHAFDYCFGTYGACVVYKELLAERRVRRLSGLLTPTQVAAAAAEAAASNSSPGLQPDATRRPLVQLTVCRPTSPAPGRIGPHADRYPQPAAAA